MNALKMEKEVAKRFKDLLKPFNTKIFKISKHNNE